MARRYRPRGSTTQWDALRVSQLVDRYAKVIDQTDLDYGDIARILDASPRAVYRWLSEGRDPRWDTRERLLELAVVLERLVNVIRPEAAADWLFTPNPYLDHDKPVSRLRSGSYKEVLSVIDALGEGVFT